MTMYRGRRQLSNYWKIEINFVRPQQLELLANSGALGNTFKESLLKYQIVKYIAAHCDVVWLERRVLTRKICIAPSTPDTVHPLLWHYTDSDWLALSLQGVTSCHTSYQASLCVIAAKVFLEFWLFIFKTWLCLTRSYSYVTSLC